MPYTPPAGDAVDFSWVGASAYTPPAGDAVDFQWSPDTVQGRIAVPGPLGAPAGQIRVLRYQLRGEVRNQGVLVDRRVRAYLRSSGALVAQGDTVAGAFALDVGFAADEYTVLPINLAGDATDYTPPAANRVVSVLAQDAP